MIQAAMNFDPGALKKNPDGSYDVETLLATPHGPAQVSLETPGEHSTHQLRSLEEFLAHWPDLITRLQRPLFSYYWSMLVGATDSGPRISSEDEVLKCVTLRTIEAPDFEHLGNRHIRIIGGCSWEEEHGLEIHVSNARNVIFCGAFAGGIEPEPPCQDDWNFALPANQETVFEQASIEDEDLEELSLKSPDPDELKSHAAPAELRPKARRPWWKRW